MIAGMIVMYASMPATLSVIAPLETATVLLEALALQAGQMVAPSATCAPHALQNAIIVSPEPIFPWRPA
jgi:hypothetical protein